MGSALLTRSNRRAITTWPSLVPPRNVLRDSRQSFGEIAMVGEGKPAPFHVEIKFSLLRIASLPCLFVAFVSVLIERSHSLAYAVQHQRGPHPIPLGV
jgi:hypothetical protein